MRLSCLPDRDRATLLRMLADHTIRHVRRTVANTPLTGEEWEYIDAVVAAAQELKAFAKTKARKNKK